MEITIAKMVLTKMDVRISTSAILMTLGFIKYIYIMVKRVKVL